MKQALLLGLAGLCLALTLPGCSQGDLFAPSALGSFEQAEAANPRVIEDEDRADRLALLQSGIAAEAKRYFRFWGWTHEDARILNADYDVTSDAFTRLAGELRRERRETRKRIILLSMRMRREMSEEEWERFVEEAN